MGKRRWRGATQFREIFTHALIGAIVSNIQTTVIVVLINDNSKYKPVIRVDKHKHGKPQTTSGQVDSRVK